MSKYQVSDGSHTTDIFNTLAEAQFDLFVRYCHFTQDMDDCYYTPEKTEKQLMKAKSFEFYAYADDEGTPNWNRKYYATLEKIAA